MKTQLFLLILFSSLLVSCGSGGNGTGFPGSGDQSQTPARMEAQSQEDHIDHSRMLIREGDLRFETGDITKARNFLLGSIERLGGIVAQDNIYEYDDRITHRLSVRVPAMAFDRLIDTISAYADKLEHLNVSTLDVTEEFIDVESRLRNKMLLEERYHQLLASAHTVEEMLKIEKELAQIRSEIESVEGRLNFLKDKVAMSSLQIEFYQHTSASFSFSSKLTRSIGEGWNYFLSFLIVLVKLWPFILLLMLIIFGSIWYGKRNAKKVK